MGVTYTYVLHSRKFINKFSEALHSDLEFLYKSFYLLR